MRWLSKFRSGGTTKKRDHGVARERRRNGPVAEDCSAIIARERMALREENDRILARERQALIEENASILDHDRSIMESEVNINAMDKIKRVYYEMARSKAELANLKNALSVLAEPWQLDTHHAALCVLTESATSWQEALHAQSFPHSLHSPDLIKSS